MTATRLLHVSMIVACLSLGGLGGTAALGSVMVFDRVAVKGQPVRLVVQTKGRIFKEGGRLVDIYVDDHHLKQIMTGGDGYGYLTYSPGDPGLKEITARSQGSRASGRLLVMQPSERAVLIEIEAVLKNTLFSEKARSQAAAAVKTIQKSFRIIYLVRFVGQGLANTWLSRSDFPASVVLVWRGPQMLSHFQEKGLQLYAIIGSQSVFEAAEGLIEKRFLIDPDAEGDWNKILESLDH